MTIDQITTLAASGESEALEFKETTGTRREAVGAGRIERQGIGRVHEPRAVDALDAWAWGAIGARMCAMGA